MAERHQGSLPPVHSFVRLEPSNLVLTSVKIAEDDPVAWMMQFYEATGEDSRAVLTLPAEPKRVFTSDFLEQSGEMIVPDGNRIEINAGENSVCTVKAIF
jgi:hypothetical protein